MPLAVDMGLVMDRAQARVGLPIFPTRSSLGAAQDMAGLAARVRVLRPAAVRTVQSLLRPISAVAEAPAPAPGALAVARSRSWPGACYGSVDESQPAAQT